NIIRNITMMSFANLCACGLLRRSSASVTRSKSNRVLELSQRHVFAGRLLKPFRQLDPCFYYALVAVLRDVALSRALSKDGIIFLRHKQPVFGQLRHLIFEVIHRFRAWNVVGQMLEQVPEHFGPQDLMNPYLGPGLSLQVNIAKQVFSFVRVKSEPRAAQGRSASAEQKTIYMRRAHGMRNESGDRIRRKLNWIFVVHTPVDP